MTALLLGLLWKFSGYIIAGVGALVGFLAWRTRERRVGAAQERAKREAADRMVEDIADQVQSDVGSMSPEQIDAELRKRAKK
jgi:hypothetical protein